MRPPEMRGSSFERATIIGETAEIEWNRAA